MLTWSATDMAVSIHCMHEIMTSLLMKKSLRKLSDDSICMYIGRLHSFNFWNSYMDRNPGALVHKWNGLQICSLISYTIWKWQNKGKGPFFNHIVLFFFKICISWQNLKVCKKVSTYLFGRKFTKISNNFWRLLILHQFFRIFEN